MARSVDTWVGKSDDTTPPPRVRVRVFEAKKGRCHKCTRKVLAGEAWTLEHVVALINGGRNAEDNLDVTCCNCLPVKNAEDMAVKAKSYAVKSKFLLPRAPSRLRSAGFPKRERQHTATRPMRAKETL